MCVDMGGGSHFREKGVHRVFMKRGVHRGFTKSWDHVNPVNPLATRVIVTVLQIVLLLNICANITIASIFNIYLKLIRHIFK